MQSKMALGEITGEQKTIVQPTSITPPLTQPYGNRKINALHNSRKSHCFRTLLTKALDCATTFPVFSPSSFLTKCLTPQIMEMHMVSSVPMPRRPWTKLFPWANMCVLSFHSTSCLQIITDICLTLAH